MNLNRSTFSQLLAIGTVALLLSPPAFGQTIPNPSFETDTFTVSPGYITNNSPITGWTGTPADRVGLNPAGGNTFANNGVIPAGNNVAFIQANEADPGNPSTLGTTISGLNTGTKYKVTFRANASTTNTPNLKVYIDGIAVLLPGGPDGMAPAPVTGSNPYWFVAFEFTATAASQALTIVNDAVGNQTLLVDDFQIAPSSGNWTIDAWTDDASSGVDPTYYYTHAYSFGSAANVTINNINFTGVAGTSPNVAGSFSSTFLGAGPVGDTFNFVTGSGTTLAANFVYGGNVPAGSFESITVSGLMPGTNYVMTIYSVAWDDPSEVNRWITASAGSDYLTFNQDQFYLDNGFRISYRYTADPSGTMTLKFAPLIPNTTFHVYGFANREANSRLVAPLITGDPQSMIVSPNVQTTFNVIASGVPLPTYQWRFNGTAINSETNSSLSVLATPAIAGLYDVIVANAGGSVTSRVARLTVGATAIVNPSFEADVFTVWPGYVNANGPITGWNTLGGHGLNPVQDGRSPFADNGVIPQGNQVLFMQDNGTNSQVVSGFTVGNQYYLHYYENARTGGVPSSEAKVNGVTVVPAHAVTPVGGSNPYYEISSEMFVAAATDLELAFVKSNPQGGDTTALIDNIAIIAVPPGTPPVIGMQPKSTTVVVGQPVSLSAVAQGSLPLSYQWRLNNQPVAGATNPTFSLSAVGLSDEGDYTLVVANASGSVTSLVARISLLEPISSLRNTGIDAGGSPQAPGAVSSIWTLPVNADSASADAFVGLEQFPIGTWMNNSAVSKWIGPRADLGGTIADGDYVYRTTFNLANRDTNTVLIIGQWASDNTGTAVTVNGTAVNVPQSPSFTAWTSFTITSTNATFLPGQNTIEFSVNNTPPAGPTGLRVEFTKTSARTLPGVGASVAVSPQGGKVVEGSDVVLNVVADGTLPISYQWRKNNADLAGETNTSLTLANVTTNTTGNYSVRVSNPWGNDVSADAFVNVAYRPLPGFYGTGVDTNGALLADGAVDPHYILATSADVSYPGPDAIAVNDVWPIAPAGPWLANGPDSRWIAPQPNQNQSSDPLGVNAEGDYTYQTTFDLTGYDLSRVSLVGTLAVDNTVTDVLVNGVSTGITSPGFTAYTPFTITSGLVAGINTLDFVMNNAGTAPSPTGLRVNLQGLLNIETSQPAVTLQIGRSGNSVTISWSPSASGQKLWSAPSVNGPWTEIPNAANPYVTSPSATSAFYRVSQ